MAESKATMVEITKRDTIRQQYDELVRRLRSPEGPKQLTPLRRMHIRIEACFEAIADLQFPGYEKYMNGFKVYHGAVVSNITTKISVLQAADERFRSITQQPEPSTSANAQLKRDDSPGINLHATNSDVEMIDGPGRSDDEVLKAAQERRREQMGDAKGRKVIMDEGEYTVASPRSYQSLSDGGKPRGRPSIRGKGYVKSVCVVPRRPIFGRLGSNQSRRNSKDHSQRDSPERQQVREHLREMVLSPQRDGTRTPSPHEPPNAKVQLTPGRLYQTATATEAPYCLCCIMYKQYHI